MYELPKYTDLELKKALVMWRHMLNIGPEFDTNEEQIPITDTDYQWIVDNYSQIADKVEHTYFYTIHGPDPSCNEGNYSRSQMKSDMYNSYHEQLNHYYKLRYILEHYKIQSLLNDCNTRIAETRTKIEPEPHIKWINNPPPWFCVTPSHILW